MDNCSIASESQWRRHCWPCLVARVRVRPSADPPGTAAPAARGARTSRRHGG